MNTLIFAAIDVAFDSLNLALSIARFAVAAAVTIHEVGQATIKAGAATRSVVQDWVDDLVAKSESQAAPVNSIPDWWELEFTPAPQAQVANNVVPFPTMPRLLAPVAVAGYLPQAVDPMPALESLAAPQTDYNTMGIRALRQLAKAAKVKGYSKLSKAQLVEVLAA